MEERQKERKKKEPWHHTKSPASHPCVEVRVSVCLWWRSQLGSHRWGTKEKQEEVEEELVYISQSSNTLHGDMDTLSNPLRTAHPTPLSTLPIQTQASPDRRGTCHRRTPNMCEWATRFKGVPGSAPSEVWGPILNQPNSSLFSKG